MNRIEYTIGNILRWGVIVSAIIMIIGLFLYIIKDSFGYPKGYYAKSFSQIITGIIEMKPYSIMMLGIFALILTPVLRVIVSIYSFYKEHDHLYVIITSVVLIILIFSFGLGLFLHL
nr:DUF1634 domain-containing protein [Fructilactobacillus lindneri]